MPYQLEPLSVALLTALARLKCQYNSVRFTPFSLEDGEERLAERGLGLVAQDLLGILCSGDVSKGC